jgi:phosphoenolpyruvate carboxylase
MTEIRSIEFPEKDRPLRDDVSVLGQLLGEVLIEQHGPELLEQVELVRKASILRREGEKDSALVLEHTLKTLSTDQLQLIVKAFSSYLRLANIAEKVHRIRRNRFYLRNHESRQRGSFEDIIQSLEQSGISHTQLQNALDGLQIRPVFTAHPTESTRRSILEKEYSIIHRLVERLNPERTPDEDAQALARVRDAVTSAWQTRAVSHSRPTVSDEMDSLLFYLTEILYRVVAPFEESLQSTLDKTYGVGVITGPKPDLLRFGTWVGGDMDGNPNVSAKTVHATLVAQRKAIIRCYLPEIKRMGRYLSQSRGEADISAALENQLLIYGELMPQTLQEIPTRHLDMPYRCFLILVTARLNSTLEIGGNSYADPEEFENDISLISDSLRKGKGEHAGLFGVRRLLIRIRTFGFHLATLDVRQDAQLHREVMGELLEIPDWVDWSVEKRIGKLADVLAASQLPDPDKTNGISDQTIGALEVFKTIRQSRAEFGDAATGLFIISMTQAADDVLTTLVLARIAGFSGEKGIALDVTPLLETVDDLEAGPEILTQLMALDVYRQHLKQRGDRQFVMVGYSDSSKDSGIVASRWGLQQAQFRMSEIAREHKLKLAYFHGRGGTVSRGGGNLVNGISGAPEGTIGGVMRVTEQGEVINQKYGIRPLALRNLELITGAVLQHGLVDVGQHPDAGMRDMMKKMSACARTKYQKLVYGTPDFIEFFRRATPIDVIERLAIGSRPASRRSGLGIENLRAIPWVFSWAQTRIGLPGVFGMGTALEWAKYEYGIDALKSMYEKWSFFRGMINDVEMVLAKSELEIGQRYSQLAGPGLGHMFTRIDAEFGLATQHILELKEIPELLANEETLRRNIRLRNPYVDPLHIVQIDLLQRWRDSERSDESLLEALKATVNGIALGIQNTG